MAVGVGHQLIGLLGGRIEAHRMVHRMVLRKRQLAVAAIHRAAGGVNQMANPLVAATLQDCSKANQIALQIGRRVLDRVTHPRLGGEMHHPVGAQLGKQSGDGFCVL